MDTREVFIFLNKLIYLGKLCFKGVEVNLLAVYVALTVAEIFFTVVVTAFTEQ